MQEAGSKPRYAHSPDTANVQSGPTAGSGRRQAATTAIFLQEACFKHCYIRSRDMSAVVERPERLRAVHLGISAAMARLQEIEPRGSTDSQDDDLAATLERMDLNTTLLEPSSPFFSIVRNSPAANMLNHPAVKFVHGDIDGDVYLENLQRWAKQSVNVIAKGESEIPDDLSQTDLYLCPTSIDALQGAIGTVCEAVNTVLESSHNETAARRAFVAIRPPGHHCGEDTPSGFCFINNVAIGAAHAHLKHGVRRVVIFDIDLHHGNGTQSLIWQINEETFRQSLEPEQIKSETKPGLQIYYSSIHDILSYPCEDGKAQLVQAASVSIHGPHGQYIENIHLEPYPSESHFWDVLYEQRYKRVFTKARQFIEETAQQAAPGTNDDVLVFISCGFDACEHEYPSMSRHGRKVPTSYFHRFAKDACAFADEHAGGRVVSVLEGGYSDRALLGGTMAHVCGLVSASDRTAEIDEGWWGVDNLIKLERLLKKRKGGRPSLTPQQPLESWLERSSTFFSSFDANSQQLMTAASPRVVSPSSMTLRNRKKAPQDPGPSLMPPPASIPASGEDAHSQGGDNIGAATRAVSEESPVMQKKVPRVILRVGPPPGAL